MATKTWSGGATGNWNVSGNWTPSGVPATGDDVVINTSGCDVTLDVHIGGGQTNTGLNSLTITSGLLDTNDGSNRLLTVTGAVDIGTAGDLDLNGSDVSFGTLNVANGAAASIIFSSATTTITLEPNSTHPTWGFSLGSAATVNFNGGTIKFAKVTSGTRYLQMGGQGVHVLNDVIIDTNYNIPWASHFEAASLDIQDGQLNSYGGSDSITITGDLTIGNGTDAAALTYTADSNGFHDQTFGSVTINSNGTLEASNQTTTIKGNASSSTNLALNIDSNATFTHNSGTILFDGTNTFGGSSYGHFYFGDQTFNNITINASGKFIQPRKSGTTTLDIDGDLTITAGQLSNYNNDIIWDIAGDVDVSGTLGITNSTGAYSFGGIRINSGGTYNATSGTTTVTNRFTGTANVWKNDGGTFTHNNGTVKFTDNDHSKVKEQGSFYNFEQASSFGDYALLWETAGGGSCTILNNLTITRGDFEIDAAGDTLDIYGQTIINGSSNSGARFNNDKNQTGTITHHGLVTIIQGTYHVEDGATVNMAGIRNVGGLVD